MEPRIERAKNELRSALNGLVAGESFNIIGFSEAAKRFKKTLLPATPDNIRMANKWLDNIPLDGGTDVGKAMKQAFSVKGANINVVVLITDGVPNYGITDFDQLAQAIRSMNITGARIDTIGLKGDNFDDEDGTSAADREFGASKLLQQIAKDSGGGYHLVPDQ